jgi:hypothetical protein
MARRFDDSSRLGNDLSEISEEPAREDQPARRTVTWHQPAVGPIAPVCGTFVPATAVGPILRGELSEGTDDGDPATAAATEQPSLPVTTTEPADLQVLSERMMGLEPTTFCMASARRGVRMDAARCGTRSVPTPHPNQRCRSKWLGADLRFQSGSKPYAHGRES